MIFIKKHYELIFHASLCALAFLLPFYREISTLVLWAVAILFFFWFFFVPSKIEFSAATPFAGLAYFLMLLVCLIHTENLSVGIFQLDKKIAFILFPLIFMFTGDSIAKEKIIYSFITGCFAAALICIVAAVFKSFQIDNGILIFTASPQNPNLSFFESITKGGNNFFDQHFSLFISPIYFAMYINFAIVAIFYTQAFRGLRVLKFSLIGFFVIILFLLSSKLGFAFILFFILTLLFSVKQIVGVNSKLCLGIIFIVLITLTFANPRTKSVINEYLKGDLNLDKKKGYLTSTPLRLMAWTASIEIIREHPWFGVGTGDMEDEMRNKYEQLGFVTALNKKLNSHNQFFDDIGRLGLVGGLILPITLLLSLYHAFRQQNWILVYFILLILINFCFESTLQRFHGVSFFTLFFFLLNKERKNSYLLH